MKLFFRLNGANVRVDGVADCGRRLGKVATVLDPAGPNPGLDHLNPLGMFALVTLATVWFEAKETWDGLVVGEYEWISAELIRDGVDERHVHIEKKRAEPSPRSFPNGLENGGVN